MSGRRPRGPDEVQPVLTNHDLASSTWLKLVKYLDEQLATLRTKNDGLDNDATATAALRGRIAALKGLKALGEKLPELD